jgi:hypothetical protein
VKNREQGDGTECQYHQYRKKLRWSTDFNISFNRNKVTDLKFTAILHVWLHLQQQLVCFIVRVGDPLGTFFGYIAEGVDPATGNMKYKDVNKNGH